MSSPCPCGRSLAYAGCCGRLHQQLERPATAEDLMRSRYSAFALQLADYLVATLHPSRRRPGEKIALEQSFADTCWDGLVILDRQAGNSGDSSGVVEFVAHFHSLQPHNPQRAGQIHERSRFVCEDGQWLYVDGDLLPPLLPGRNDPCWCGSGKKFKKCHG